MDFMQIFAMLLGGGLISFIQFMITRNDAKAKKIDNVINQIDDIKKSQLKAEKDIVRSQLLVLMSDYPENQPEIMEAMKHYHVDLNGNWYLTSLFKKWCEKNDIDKPKWLD